METLINNIECTYRYRIYVLKQKFHELYLEKQQAIEDLNQLGNTQNINPYYYQAQFIILTTLIDILNVKMENVNEKIKNIKYEIGN